MRINKIKRRYAKMMNDLPDNDLIACIYMLCSELIYRSDNTVTMEDVLTSIWSIGKLIDHNKEAQEQKTGHWKRMEVRGSESLVCSECFADLGSTYPENYCPNCGVRMKSEDTEC